MAGWSFRCSNTRSLSFLCRKNFKLHSLFAVCAMVLSVSARAQSPDSPAAAVPSDKGASSAQTVSGLIPSDPSSVNPLHSIPPSSLIEMRLHPAHLPLEAELSCSYIFGCQLGLTRGFSVGSDATKTLGVTLLGQHLFGPGAWTYLDGAVGYQFLRQVERQATFMGTLGYKSYSYKNSESAKLSRAGMNFRTAYAESVLPAYTQGLVFDAFSSTLSTAGGAELPFLRADDKKVRSLIREFALFMRSNPVVRLQLPADLEVINWKPSQVDLPAAMRGFLRVNPIYEQTDLIVRSGGESVYSWIEKRFALQLMLMTAYASPAQKAGRLGLLGGLGFEMAATRDTLETKAPSQELNPVVPDPALVSGKLEIQVNYQF